jgi:DNA-binding transcriptional MerR regulator
LDKAPDAFRTISEVADDLDVPQHVLRFWETRFAQIRPMKRSGGRRYYRPDDVDLLKGIRQLLYGEGYTIRGVQRILKEQGVKAVQGLSNGAGLSPARGEERAAPSAVEEIEDDAAEIAGDDEGIEDTDGFEDRSEEIQEPQARVEPVLQARQETDVRPSVDMGRALREQRRQDADRLRAVLTDLHACRQLLDEAMKGPDPLHSAASP